MRFRLPGLLFSRVLVVVLLVSLGLPWAKASLLVSASMPRAMHLSPRSSDTAEGRGTAEADQSVDEMIARIQQEGRIRVLIGVRPSGLEERQAVAITDEKRMRIVAAGQLELLDRMSTYSLSSVNRFKYIPFLGATVDGRALKALRADPGVTSIELVKYAAPLLSESGPMIGAPNAWSAGYSGAGWEVAILDTGVDRMHPFLAGKVTAEGCYSNTENAEDRVSLCPSGQGVQTGEGAAAPCAITGCDHGTHVAGIAAGSGVDFSGIARDAGIIAVQIFSRLDDPAQCAEAGRTAPCILASDEDQVRGLELVYSLRLSHQIAAVNLSIGGGRYQDQSQCDSSNQAVKSEVDLLLGAGIATIAASGNDEYVGAMNAPACISSVYSIGASTKDDRVASYSNTAPWLALYAPGGDFPPGSSDCTGGSTCIYSSVSMLPYGSYGYKAGTSMAAPHITGAWAVLKSTKASASAGEIYSTIQQTGHWLTDNRDGLSRPRIQLDEAVERLKPPSSDTTAPTASWISPSNGQTIVSRTLHLEANASDDASGVKEVRFSAKYNGAWNGLAVDTSSPYVFDWDMCAYGVPDGDVELGLEATDNAGNKYVYSQDPANGGNIHISKSYNCNTPPTQGCAAPTLIAPSDGETLSSRTITFSWNPIGGCTFNGYTFRVCTSSDVSNLDNCFIDTGEANTQHTETINNHDNMDLWWGVKAANEATTASWAARRFRINPAAANGQWSASYFNTRTCWDDHNNCNGTTFNETLYVPGGGTLIDKNYGSSSPGGSIGSDNWTGRYEGTFNFATGNYVFYADHDDGLKLNIWNYGEHTKDSSGTNSVICNGNGGYFLSGDMPIRLYLREDGGDAKIKLRWSTDTSVCGSGSGGGVTGGSWSADYFNTRTCWDDHNNCNGTTYHDSPSFPGADTLIDKNWGQSSPGGGIGPDNWTGRFINTFNFQPAKYVFYADHDDGLKLQFGSYGEHTKDSSGSNSMICDGADGYYLSGNQQVKLYLREDGGDARVKLRWNTDTTACLPVPSAPTGVVASDGTYSDHIRLTWNAASYATVYEVWRNSTNNSATAAVIHNYVTATSYDDAYIVPGQTYYYWIKAKNSKGTSGFSASDSGFASVPPPAAPTDVSASDGDYTDNVQITWLAVPGASTYDVWRNTADDSGTATQIVAAVNGTTYIDLSVAVGQTYYYWVKARNVSGAGPFSASDSGYAIVPAPTAPTGITASDGEYLDRVRVSWLAVAGATSYEIWRNTSNTSVSATRIAQNVNGTEYEDIGTTSDQTYFYWVKAVNAGGTSGFSIPDTGYSQAPAPTAVTDLVMTRSLADGALTWSHSDPDVTHYEVYRSENPYFTPGQADSIKLEPDVAAPTSGTVVSYPGSALWPGVGVPNFYAVRAVNQFGAASMTSNRVGSFTFSLQSEGDPAPGSLLNGGFEDGSTAPAQWATEAWASGRTTFTWDIAHPRSGSRSIKIVSDQEDDARWIQTVVVQSQTDYRLSGCIKTENVAHRPDGTDAGANLSLMGGWIRSEGVFGTSDWTCTSVVFNTGTDTQVTVAARLGFYSGTTTGTAWFDDLRLERMDTVQSIVVQVDADTQDGMEDTYFSISGDGAHNNWVGVSPAVMTGWVFPMINIPRGATIADAHIRTYGFGIDGSTTTRIYGFAQDFAPVFAADGSNRPSTRPTTAAYVDWPKTWAFAWQWIETPNFANVVQEIVNRPGWVSGNALGIRANIPSGMGTNWCSVDYAAGSERTTLYVTYSVP